MTAESKRCVSSSLMPCKVCYCSLAGKGGLRVVLYSDASVLLTDVKYKFYKMASEDTNVLN